MHELSKDQAYLRKDKFTICIYDVYTTFCIVYCTVYTTYSANIKMPTVEGQDQPHKTHVGKSSAFDELHTLPLLKFELQHCMIRTVGFGNSLQLLCSIDSIWLRPDTTTIFKQCIEMYRSYRK